MPIELGPTEVIYRSGVTINGQMYGKQHEDGSVSLELDTGKEGTATFK